MLTEMSTLNNFDVLKEMGERNLDIAAATDLMNFQRQDKKGGGLVTVGVANPAFDHLINGAGIGSPTHHAVLLIYNIKQFNELSEELNKKH